MLKMTLNKKLPTLILTTSIGFSLLFSTTLPAQITTPQRNNQAQQVYFDVVEFDKQSTIVQENFKKMQEQMEVIRATKDLEVRKKLIEEHWTTMQTNNNLMDGIWAKGIKSCCGGPSFMMDRGRMMGWNGMGGYYSKLTPKEQMQRQYMTDQFIGMQQMMMNQMMQQNNMMMNPWR